MKVQEKLTYTNERGGKHCLFPRFFVSRKLQGRFRLV